MLAHVGSKDNTIFQVRWKTSKISWLPYHQVAHLVAITDYLETIRVSSIGTLMEGNGSSPDDPQLFAGSLDLASLKGWVGEDSPTDALTLGPSLLVGAMDITTSDSASNAPSSQDSPALPNQDGSAVNDITPANQMIFSKFLNTASATGHFTIDLGSPIPGFANLYKLSWDVYVTCRPTTHEMCTYHATQVQAFIKFDVALQASEQPSDLIMPAGYDDFAHVINTENFSY